MFIVHIARSPDGYDAAAIRRALEHSLRSVNRCDRTPATSWSLDALCVAANDAGAPRPNGRRTDAHTPRIVGTFRLDDRAVLANAVGLPIESDDATLIEAGALRWSDERLWSNLIGEFSLFKWDVRRKSGAAARDRLGIQRLFYSAIPSGWVFSSSLLAIARSGLIQTALDSDYWTNYLHTGKSAALDECTPFASIKAVRPGHYVVCDQASCRELRYWFPEKVGPAGGGLDDAARVVRAVLERVVGDRLPSRGQIWCDVSGGLDSTVVAMIARQQLGASASSDRLRGRAIDHSMFPGHSELDYIKAAEAMLGVPIELENVRDIPPLTAVLDERWQPWDEPAISYLAYPEILRLHQRITALGGGVRLAGYGADHVFRLPSVSYLVDCAQQGEWRRLRQHFAHWATASQLSWWEFARTLVIDPYVNGRRRSPAPTAPWLASTAQSQPSAYWPYEFERWVNAEHFRHMLQGPRSAPRDPSGVVDLRLPYCDSRLVETVLAVQPWHRMAPPLPKQLLRRAAADLLPPEISEKYDQPGGTLPALFKFQRCIPAIRRLAAHSYVADAVPIDVPKLVTYVDELNVGNAEFVSPFAAWLTAELWIRGVMN